MSAAHALNGYRDAQVYIRNRKLHQEKRLSILESVMNAVKDWFHDPFFWELYEAERTVVSASEMNKLYEKWG